MSHELEEKTVDAIRNNLRLHISIDGVASVKGFEDAARAALAVVREAMADPSEEMLFAADWLENGTREAWKAMLSASPLGEQ